MTLPRFILAIAGFFFIALIPVVVDHKTQRRSACLGALVLVFILFVLLGALLS
jgi:hypothetical protein